MGESPFMYISWEGLHRIALFYCYSGKRQESQGGFRNSYASLSRMKVVGFQDQWGNIWRIVRNKLLNTQFFDRRTLVIFGLLEHPFHAAIQTPGVVIHTHSVV